MCLYVCVCVCVCIRLRVCVRVCAYAGVCKCVCACVHVCLKDCLFVCFGAFMCLPLRYYQGSFSLALTCVLSRGLSLYFLSFFLVRACSESFSLSLRIQIHLSPFHSRSFCLSPTDTLFLLPSHAFSFAHSPSLTSSFPLSLSIFLSFTPCDFLSYIPRTPPSPHLVLARSFF